jgi:hypothetical protein
MTNTATEARTYAVGLPVLVTVHPDGRVQYDVDTAETSSAMLSDSDTGQGYTDEQIDRDRAAVDLDHTRRQTVDGRAALAFQDAAAAERVIVLTALADVAETMREHHPDATQVRLEWSDQGDWLTPRDIDADTDLTDEASALLYETVNAFAGSNEYLWGRFCSGTADRHGRGFYTLDLAVCSTALDHLNAGTLPDPTPTA